MRVIRHLAAISLGIFVLPLLFVPSAKALNLTLGHDPLSGYSLSWESIDPSTTDAVVSYYVYEKFGLCGFNTAPDLSAISFSSNATAVTLQTSINIGSGVGSRCFVVRSSDSLGGVGYTSDTECHNFVHHLTSEGILRADGDGTQRGVDQKWEFTYSLDVDAYLTATIYPPGSVFTLDSNCFVASVSSVAVSTLTQNIPRSGELASHTIEMKEQWSSRSSTGAIVPNGIYYLMMSARVDSGFFSNGTPPNVARWDSTPQTYVRGSIVNTIPVDIIRIMDLAATAITLTNTRSSISYFITGDANVRVLIAKPGSAFTVDANGDVQVTDRTTGAIDNTLLVSTFSFQRKAGNNTESWDGTSSTGTVMPSGVYAVSVSATDDYGNHAIDIGGNDYAPFANITLERAAGSTTGSTTTGDTTPATIAAMTVDGGAFSDGQLFTGAVSTITVQLSDVSGIGFGLSNITVVGPNSQSVAGTLSNNGTDTMTFAFTTSQNTNGVYTITITAADAIGNSTTYTRTFVISVQLSQSVFENGLKLYPNPTKNATSATIEYDVTEAATVSIEIFNILGEKVYSASYTQAAAANNVLRTWPLTNNDGEKVGSGLYLVRVKAVGATSTVETVKKLVVIR
jgi:flagellar hook assembly protein FlgD